jgi:hypothetical protein
MAEIPSNQSDDAPAAANNPAKRKRLAELLLWTGIIGSGVGIGISEAGEKKLNRKPYNGAGWAGAIAGIIGIGGYFLMRRPAPKIKNQTSPPIPEQMTDGEKDSNKESKNGFVNRLQQEREADTGKGR